jgi:hypothetical protein
MYRQERRAHALDWLDTSGRVTRGQRVIPKIALTQKRLHELVLYVPSSGNFYWKHARGPRKAGALAGSPQVGGYWSIYIDGKDYLAHRLAWYYVYGHWPDGGLDHIDHDKRDNRIHMLRPADDAQNAWNSVARRPNPHGRRGVRKSGTGFTASITARGVRYNLGRFASVEEAGDAYAEAAKRFHGSFAYKGA